MNYLIYGTDDYLINNKVDEIVKETKIDDISTSRYDLEIDTISQVLDDCMTVSLFEDKKIVIVNNCNYFNRVKNNNEDDITKLLNYLTNYNPSTLLILISRNETIDSVKKITKVMKENGKLVSLNETSIVDTVKSLFKGYKITTSNINLLIDRVGSDIGILATEIEKLKVYKIDDKEITKEDIINCATLNIDTDIFKFIDNIINNKKDEALKTYYELLKNNEEPIKIIALLASKFRLMYQANTLSKKGFNNNEISKMLGVHAYPVKLAIEASRRYPEFVALTYLNALANLDTDIKTGEIDAKLGLELFIMKV